MKSVPKAVVVSLFVFALCSLCPPKLVGQKVDDICSGKSVVASIPPGVIARLNAAAKEKDFEQVIRIAQQSKARLKVSSLRRDKNGEIVSYLIVNRHGCKVASYLKQP